MRQFGQSLDSKQIPFIKKFTQDGFFYVYDVNTNQIVEVEEDVFNIIDSCNMPLTDQKSLHINASLKKIRQAQKSSGLFSKFRPKKVLMGLRTADHVKDFHNKNCSQLLLELTTGCNLNCTYCSVSGNYAHAAADVQHMSRKTLKKSIDFFLRNSQNTLYPSISFYGGEPLTRFELIKESVEYVRSNLNGDKYNFNLTINGTLLNKDMVEFFIQHDFSLNVSIDGPESVHNRYRRYKDNTGSFQTIMGNMKFLKDFSPEYYAENVSITCVLAPPFDCLPEILNFFSTDDVLHDPQMKGKIRASRVNTRGTTFIEDFGLESDLEEFPAILDQFSERIKKAFKAQDLSLLTIERKHMHTVIFNLAKRGNHRLYDYVPPSGACHIGLKRLFVKTNGDFYICERSGEDYKIGHIDTGFDFEQMAYYYRKLEEVLADCKDCWALSHCERCWVRMGNLEEFKDDKKDRFCQSQKRFIEKAFKLYISLLKEDPDCLKILRKPA